MADGRPERGSQLRGRTVIFVFRPPTSIFQQEYPEGVRYQCFNI
jgi:hypothetical protein